MTPEQLKQAIQDYRDQEFTADLQREAAAKRIRAAEQEIINSYNANHYAVIYKPEYGDYADFVEKLAAELRKPNHYEPNL